MLTACAGKSGFSRLPIVLATSCFLDILAIKLLAPWRFPTSTYPAAFIAASRLTFLVSSKQPGYRETAIDRNTLGMADRLCLSRKMIFQVILLLKNAPILGTIWRPNENIPTKQRDRPRNGQARRRPVEPPGSNTRVCLIFVHRPSIFRNCCTS